MIASLLAAALSFSASATGVEKGTSIEFFFAGKGTDRDYETMFVLDEPVEAFCSRLEKAGLPCGMPVDATRSDLWPVGCRLTFDPPLSTYIDGKMPQGLPDSEPIYTGGLRQPNGIRDAATNMPLAVFSSFTLSQSPIVYDGIYNQGSVYGSFTAKEKIAKGTSVKFTVSWDPATMPRFLTLTAQPGKAVELVNQLREAQKTKNLVVRLGFDGTLTLKEAVAVANAVATLDSKQIKFNGSPDFFYRSFLPLNEWKERKGRLIQPFELTIGEPDELLRIEEDWSVDGFDPKLKPVRIMFDDVSKFNKIDTCFVYASGDTNLARISQSLAKLPASAKKKVYFFVR